MKGKRLIPSFHLHKKGEQTVTERKNSPEGRKICKQMIKNIEKDTEDLWREFDKRTIEIIKTITKKDNK